MTMRRWGTSLIIAALSASVALLGACSAPEEGESSSQPAATPTWFASSPGVQAFPAGESVDLVYLSDSAGAGVADRYATLVGEALDREVKVHDHFVGGLGDLPSAIQFAWSDEVAQAEIVVVYGNTAGLDPPQTMGACVEASGWAEEDATPGLQGEPPVVASAEDWQPVQSVLDEVYLAIWELRAGKPTIIRTHDFYNPFLAPWTELGIERECTANWEALSGVLRDAAQANGVGFASLLDVFNGTTHDEDPREKGWIDVDGAHTSEAGAAVIAETLAAVGFDALRPTTE